MVWLVLGQPAAQAQAPVVPQDVMDNIRARVTNAYSAGIVVGMVNRDGATYFSYGVGDLDTATPVDESSVFEIGSITERVLRQLTGRRRNP